MTIWDQSNDRGLASDAQLIQCTIFCFSSVSWQKSLTTTSDSDTEPHLENNVAVAMEGVEMDDDEGDPFRDDGKFPSGTTPPLLWPQSTSDISHRTNQAEWRPIGPFVNTSRPDHAALHGTLTVASNMKKSMTFMRRPWILSWHRIGRLGDSWRHWRRTYQTFAAAIFPYVRLRARLRVHTNQPMIFLS